MNCIEKIELKYPDLTKKQREIADYILQNPQDICHITLAQLAQRVGMSEVTLLRFCQRVGYERFLDLKAAFRVYTQDMITQMTTAFYFTPVLEERTITEKERLLWEICQEEAKAQSVFMEQFDMKTIIEAGEQIVKSKRVFIFAHDISAVLGRFLELRLHILGINAHFVELGDFAKNQAELQQLDRDSLAVVITFPKYYYPIGSISKTIQSAQVPIIAITDSDESPVAPYATVLLKVQSATKLFYNSLALPMTLLNLLASCLVMELLPEPERAAFKKTLQS